MGPQSGHLSDSKPWLKYTMQSCPERESGRAHGPGQKEMGVGLLNQAGDSPNCAS
jgi:hypothetical protein